MTKLNRIWIPVVMLVLLSPLAARAASIEAKSIELDTRFSFQHSAVSIETDFGNIDYDVTTLDLNLGVGYFFNPHWELLGGLLINHTAIDDASVTDFGLKASGYYNFTTSGAVIPFVGLGLGFVMHNGDYDNDEDDTTLIAPEIVGGLRWPFRDVVSLNLSAGYRHEDSPFGFQDGSADEFFMAFGFSYFLQGGATQ